MVPIYNYANFGNRKFKFISGEIGSPFIIRFKKKMEDKNYGKAKISFRFRISEIVKLEKISQRINMMGLISDTDIF